MNYRRAGEVIERLFSGVFDPVVAERFRAYAGLAGAWEAAVEEAGIAAAAAHSRVAGHERGIVTVEADHPGWVQVLQTKEGELLDILRRRARGGTEVTGISCRLMRAD